MRVRSATLSSFQKRKNRPRAGFFPLTPRVLASWEEGLVVKTDVTSSEFWRNRRGAKVASFLWGAASADTSGLMLAIYLASKMNPLFANAEAGENSPKQFISRHAASDLAQRIMGQPQFFR